jgi:hypothetical protein
VKAILSRKFLAPLFFAFLVILNRKVNLNLSANDLWMIAVGFTGFVLGESIVDAAAVKNNGNGNGKNGGHGTPPAGPQP